MDYQLMKPVTLEDSQVRLSLQVAQLDAERKISITHHKQKFSFPKLTIVIEELCGVCSEGFPVLLGAWDGLRYFIPGPSIKLLCKSLSIANIR